MKKLMILSMIGAAVYAYFQVKELSKTDLISPLPATAQDVQAVEQQKAAEVPAATPAPESAAKKEEDEALEDAPKPTRQVRIHDKWYDYRQDNTYLVDGVPTLFIPQKSQERTLIKTKVIAVEHIRPGMKNLPPEEKEIKNPKAREPSQQQVPARPAAAGAAEPNANMQKAQTLYKMVSENPLKAYTPDGFKALSNGLNAAKNAQNNRVSDLEKITNGN